MRLWALLLPVLFSASALRGSAAQPSPLTTIAAVRALSHQQAAQKLPVDLEATVTFSREYEGTLFIQEGDSAIYVNPQNLKLRLQPGDVVRVRGTTADSFTPIIQPADVSFLRHGKLPEPVSAEWPSLIRSDLDCRWVKVRGKVMLAETGLTTGRTVTHLVLRMNGGLAGVSIDSVDQAMLNDLLDAEVELTAVAAEQFDGKLQQTGVQLSAASFKYIRILKRSAVNPWTTPLTSMDRVLRNYNVQENTPHVRVEGTLTYYHPHEIAVLQEGSKSIRVQTSQVDRLNIGERVEALGIPIVDDGFMTLKMGRIRPIGIGDASATAKKVSWEEVSSGKYSFDLVTINGTLVAQIQEYSRDVYMISSGAKLFSASLRHAYPYNWPPPQVPAPMRYLPIGSKVNVTGVAILENGDPYSGPVSFSVLLRTADDIAVEANPPWLNVRHLVEVVGVLVLIVLLVGVRAWLVERNARSSVAGIAYLEKRRARVLELITAAQPLTEILQEITELVSASLNGAPSWCQVVDGQRIGNFPAMDREPMRIVETTIPSRKSVPLGTVAAAFHRGSAAKPSEMEALSMAARLASLAIETSQLYSDLVHRSEFDALTNVQNRFSMEKILESQITLSNESASIFGLLYIDLDNFKQVNDEHGHHVGDIYLQEVAERLQSRLRPGDVLARLGGDEFAVMTPGVHNRNDILEIAHRIEYCFSEPFDLDGHVIHGAASVGVAAYPDDGKTMDVLLTAADAAMYVAKQMRRADRRKSEKYV